MHACTGIMNINLAIPHPFIAPEIFLPQIHVAHSHCGPYAFAPFWGTSASSRVRRRSLLVWNGGFCCRSTYMWVGFPPIKIKTDTFCLTIFSLFFWLVALVASRSKNFRLCSRGTSELPQHFCGKCLYAQVLLAFGPARRRFSQDLRNWRRRRMPCQGTQIPKPVIGCFKGKKQEGRRSFGRSRCLTGLQLEHEHLDVGSVWGDSCCHQWLERAFGNALLLGWISHITTNHNDNNPFLLDNI